MNAVIPFAFEEQLVRVVKRGEEPWFVGRDVCRVLGIKNESDALADLDDDEREAGVGISDPSGTKYAIIVSEPGVYRLVFRSRRPQAERFKRWLAHDVLPSIRKTGGYRANDQAAPRPEARRLEPQTYSEALETVRLIRMTAGREAARRAWDVLGLPAIPAAPATRCDDGRECLEHLLEASAGEGRGSVRSLIEVAVTGGSEHAALELEDMGLRLLREGEVLYVANSHPRLDEVFAGTPWLWHIALRHVPGAVASGPVRCGGQQWRGTLLPVAVLGLRGRLYDVA